MEEILGSDEFAAELIGNGPVMTIEECMQNTEPYVYKKARMVAYCHSLMVPSQTFYLLEHNIQESPYVLYIVSPNDVKNGLWPYTSFTNGIETLNPFNN